MAENQRKAELIADLARARTQISRDVHIVRRDLDFPTRARQAFARHPAIWIGVALVLGLFVARIPLRRKKTVAPRKSAEPMIEKAGMAGVAITALKFAFDIARPALMSWATRRFAQQFDPSAYRDNNRR